MKMLVWKKLYSYSLTTSVPDVRWNHFALRQYHFSMRWYHFAVRQYHFSVRRNDFLVRQYHFSMRRNDFLVRQYHFSVRRNDFVVRQYHFSMRRNDFVEPRKALECGFLSLSSFKMLLPFHTNSGILYELSPDFLPNQPHSSQV